MPSTPDATLTGDTSLPERYVLGELLGRGAMAEVCRAHDRLLDRAVAVKVFSAHPDPVARQRFDDEARALARLGHPGLVSIFDVGLAGERPYLVMRLIEGESLQTRLLAGPLTPADTVRAGALLADALAHAHGRGVVHRDVKPSNILLDHDDAPHLTDFGIALLVGAARLTSTNEIIGTPAYLAPEQILGADVGSALDVYALGLVLLECLTGQMEYAGSTRLEAALARLHRPPRIPTDIPADLAELLRAMTATDPAHRPTAAQCADRLLAIGTGAIDTVAIEPSAPTTDVVPWWAGAVDDAQAQPRTPARRRRAMAAAGLGIVALILGLALATNSPPSSGGRATVGGTNASPSVRRSPETTADVARQPIPTTGTLAAAGGVAAGDARQAVAPPAVGNGLSGKGHGNGGGNGNGRGPGNGNGGGHGGKK
jgi:eukaryotic-like serine/threonine-protein kinase